MRKLLAAAFLGLLLAPSVAAAQSIGGRYTVAGTNLDGSAYEGTAEVTLASETTCIIEWQTGGTSSQGICMRNGNAFAASYVLNDHVGLTVYQVMEDGSLNGIWTVTGEEGNGTEILTPAK